MKETILKLAIILRIYGIKYFTIEDCSCINLNYAKYKAEPCKNLAVTGAWGISRRFCTIIKNHDSENEQIDGKIRDNKGRREIFLGGEGSTSRGLCNFKVVKSRTEKRVLNLI